MVHQQGDLTYLLELQFHKTERRYSFSQASTKKEEKALLGASEGAW